MFAGKNHVPNNLYNFSSASIIRASGQGQTYSIALRGVASRSTTNKYNRNVSQRAPHSYKSMKISEILLAITALFQWSDVSEIMTRFFFHNYHYYHFIFILFYLEYMDSKRNERNESQRRTPKLRFPSFSSTKFYRNDTKINVWIYL